MANEGEFPKVDGDLLYASEATKFAPAISGIGILFNNCAQCIYDVAPGVGSLFNTDYSNFSSDVLTIGSLTHMYFDTNKYTTVINTGDFSDTASPGWSVLDLFDDSSVDLSIWDITEATSATVTEGADVLTLTTAQDNASIATLENDGDLFTVFGNLVVIRINQLNCTSSSDPGAICKLTDGSNNEVIKQETTTTANAATLILEKIGDIVYYKYGGEAWGSVDVSAWADVKIHFSVTGESGGATATIILDYSYYNDAPNTHKVVTSQHNSEKIIDNAMLTMNSAISGGTVINSYELSADNGANYETIGSLNALHTFTNTGSMLSARITITSSGTIQNKDQLSSVNEYAVSYNFY